MTLFWLRWYWFCSSHQSFALSSYLHSFTSSSITLPRLMHSFIVSRVPRLAWRSACSGRADLPPVQVGLTVDDVELVLGVDGQQRCQVFDPGFRSDGTWIHPSERLRLASAALWNSMRTRLSAISARRCSSNWCGTTARRRSGAASTSSAWSCPWRACMRKRSS